MVEANGKLAVECLAFKALERNTLRGFADLKLPALRLTVKDCAVHQSGERQWVQLPSKPQIDRDGKVMMKDGKRLYAEILAFDTREVADAFSKAALDAIDRFQWGSGGHAA